MVAGEGFKNLLGSPDYVERHSILIIDLEKETGWHKVVSPRSHELRISAVTSSVAGGAPLAGLPKRVWIYTR